MKLIRKAGQTSQILQIFVRDKTSTTGAGLTGLVFNTASLTAYFHRDTDTTATVINLVTMTVGTFTSSGFKEIDATNMPGWYQFCPPNTALASGAGSVSFHLKGGGNMADLPIEMDLDAQVDVTNWLGTAVTAATAGIPDVNTKNLGNVAQTGRDVGASVLLSPGTGTGQLDITTGVVKANLVQILGTALTETAGQIAAAFKQFFNISSPTGTVNLIPAVTTVGSVTGAVGSVTARVTANADQLAGQTVSAAAGVTFPASVASPTNITAGTITTTTNLTNAPTAGDFTATMKTSLNAATPASVVGAVGSVTGNVGGNVNGNVVGSVASVVGAVGSVTAGVTVTTNNDKTGYVLSSGGVQAIWDALTSALTTAGSIGKLLAALPGSIWDVVLSGHTTAGTTGAALSSASSAGDPWATALPGAYASGTAGNIVGNNLNATVSSRLPTASISLSGGAVTVGTNNDKTGYALTSAYDPAKTVYAVPGDAMALTSGERTTLAGVIWANASRTLTSFGTLVADIATAVWGAASRTLSAFGFTVTTDVSSLVNTNLDTTVSSRLASSSYTAPPTAIQNADALLGRDMSLVSGAAARSPLNALRFLRNQWNLVSTTLTVFKEDDTTTAWTATVGTTAGADPVTSTDPT